MSSTDTSEQLRLESIEAWIQWLKEHHHKRKIAWLVFKKKGKGPVPFDYHMALDAALCYGQVDSLVKSIDDQEYKRKFTPRKASSTWSETNKQKVEVLIREGRMQDPGMECIRAAKQNGIWDKGVKISELDEFLPGALLHAFQSNPKARDHYFKMKERSRRRFNIWINTAKRPGTVQKRVDESLGLLEQEIEMGLK